VPAEIELLFTGLAAEADKFLFGTSTVAVVRAADQVIVFDTAPIAYRRSCRGVCAVPASIRGR